MALLRAAAAVLSTVEYAEGAFGLSTDGWIAVFTAVLTAATIGLGLFTYLLWRATLTAMKDASAGIAAAARSATIADEALAHAREVAAEDTKRSRRTERAYVFGGVGDVAVSENRVNLELQIVVHNVGRTPAVLREIHWGLVVGELPDAPPYASNTSSFRTEAALSAGQSGPQLAIRLPFEPDTPFTLFGFVNYVDVFDESHISKFCIDIRIGENGRPQAQTSGNEAWNSWD